MFIIGIFIKCMLCAVCCLGDGDIVVNGTEKFLALIEPVLEMACVVGEGVYT